MFMVKNNNNNKRPVLTYKRKKDVNYEALKGQMSCSEPGRVEDETGQGPTMAPCFSSCALSGPYTDLHLLSLLCDPQCA